MVRRGTAILACDVPVKDNDGNLLGSAIPHVSFHKTGRYMPGNADSAEVEILARIQENLRSSPLAGFVGEGLAPFGSLVPSMDAALERAVFSGMPVVKVGRGNAEGMVPIIPGTPFLSGSNLTATKARLLLMACLMKFGALPPAADPAHPRPEERKAVDAKLAQYQAVLSTH